MKARIMILPLLAALALTACDKANNASMEQGTTPISVKCYNSIATKAPLTTTTVPTTRKIVMSAYYNAAEGTSQNFFTNVTFTNSSSSTWACDKYWPLSGTLNFLGYSLDNISRVGGMSWGTKNTDSVTLFLSDNSSNQDDLLMGYSGSNTKSSSSIILHHAQALLTFKAKCSVAYDGTNNKGMSITAIKVNDAKFNGTVTYTSSTSTFSWTNLGATTTVAVPGLSTTTLTATDQTLGTGLLVPAQDVVSFTIYYTLHNGKDGGGSDLNTDLQYTWTPTGTWDPGKKYIYAISVTLTGITVTATAEDWVAQTATPVSI